MKDYPMVHEKAVKEAVVHVDKQLKRVHPDNTFYFFDERKKLLNAVMAQGAMRFAPMVIKLSELLKFGRNTSQDSDTAITPEDKRIRGFAVETGDKNLHAVAFDFAGDRVMAVVRQAKQKGNDRGFEKFILVRWRPDLPEDMMEEIEDVSLDKPAAIIEMAEKASEYASEESDFRISHIIDEIKAGRLTYRSWVGSVEFFQIDKEEDTRIVGRVSNPCPTAITVMENLSALGRPEQAVEWRDRHSGDFMDRFVRQAMNADRDGFGDVTRSLFGAVNSKLFLAEGMGIAKEVVRNNTAMLANGVFWPKRRMVYGDNDRSAFAIDTGNDDVSAIVHENIDLMCDENRFLTIVEKDDNGDIRSMSVFIVALPEGAALDDRDYDEVLEFILDTDAYKRYEDGHKKYTRRTQAALADDIKNGDPLPEPALHVDFAEKFVHMETLCSYRAVWDYLTSMVRNDRDVLFDEDGNLRPTPLATLSEEFGDERYMPTKMDGPKR